MPENDCKHVDGQPGKHCPDCGVTVPDPARIAVGEIVEDVLRKHGLIKEEKKGKKEQKSVLDSLIGDKK